MVPAVVSLLVPCVMIRATVFVLLIPSVAVRLTLVALLATTIIPFPIPFVSEWLMNRLGLRRWV